MAARANSLSSLRIDDLSDREMLHIVDQAAGEDNWAHTHDIANALGLTTKNRHQCVGARLAVMKQNGYVKKHREERMTWAITKLGEEMKNGVLDQTTEGQLHSLDVGGQILALRTVARDTLGKKMAGSAIRREFKHQQGKASPRR